MTMAQARKYPIGIQTFSEIREHNYLYKFKYLKMRSKLHCKKCFQCCLVKLVRCQWTNYYFITAC